ncbi:MAG: alanine dehydrogenase [Schleiferiaceae bacterium]|nr:alanine dehydrogenase [Schleiferiaceae bacterium]
MDQPAYIPQEERLMVASKRQSLRIGLPLESTWAENRVALTPEGVHLLVQQDHEILVERGAGLAARYTDHEYSEAGAQIIEDRSQVFQCPVLVKVEPPSPKEWPLMVPNQLLLSVLQPNTITADYIQALQAKKITALSYGRILDEDGRAPFVRSMAEIGGSQAITVAMEYLSTWADGKGYAMGAVTGVPPTEVVILGAGTVGTVAARLAMAMGATVKVFDSSLTRMQRLREVLGQDIYTCTLQPQILTKALSRCDVAIGALRPVAGRTPIVVTEEMVSQMKPRSVIVDVSIDHGGCFESSEVTTWDAPVYTKHGVTHFCVPNLASRVARTASFALNNLTSPFLQNLADDGGLEEALVRRAHWRAGVYMHRGILTHRELAEPFDLPFTDLDLLL